MDLIRCVHFKSVLNFRIFQSRSRVNCSGHFTVQVAHACQDLLRGPNVTSCVTQDVNKACEKRRFCWHPGPWLTMPANAGSKVSFTKKDNDTAKCNTRSKAISRKGGSTSNMTTHVLKNCVNLKECTHAPHPCWGGVHVCVYVCVCVCEIMMSDVVHLATHTVALYYKCPRSLTLSAININHCPDGAPHTPRRRCPKNNTNA